MVVGEEGPRADFGFAGDAVSGVDFAVWIVGLRADEREPGFGEVEIRLDLGEEVDVEGVLQGDGLLSPSSERLVDGIEVC